VGCYGMRAVYCDVCVVGCYGMRAVYCDCVWWDVMR
jgi:hypothetical protein